MKLVYVTHDEALTEEFKKWSPKGPYSQSYSGQKYTPKGELWSQYAKILEQYSTEASKDPELKPEIAPSLCSAAALLVDDNNKVVAGATISWSWDHEQSLVDGKHLPSYTPKDSVGYIDKVVAAPTAGMRGLELQQKILQDFKDGKGIFKESRFDDLRILAGHVVQQNALALHEAARDLNLDRVVRDDLTRKTSHGKSFFVAAARSQLVPNGYEKHVMPEEKIREAAHAELIKYKKNHPKPRQQIERGGSNKSIARG